MLPGAERRLGLQPTIVTDGGIAFEDGIGAHLGFLAEGHGAEQQFTAQHPGILEIDAVAEAGPLPQGEQLGDAQGIGADEGFIADPGAQQPQPATRQR